MEGPVYAIGLIIIGLFSLGFGIAASMKRDTGGARWLAALLFSMVFWVFGDAASMIAADTDYKFIFHTLMFIGICLVPVFAFLFVLDYYNLLKHLSIPMRSSLFVLPLITVSMISTNQYHHLFYRSVRFFEIGSYTLISGTFNIWFWIHSTYSYLLILGAVLTILYQIRSESGAFRRQSMLMIMGILTPLLFNLLTICGVLSVKADLTPFAFVLTAFIFCRSIFHVRVFEIGPITKDLLYDTIYDGLLIVNAGGSIIEHNKAFLNLFDRVPGHITGKNAIELFNSMGYSGKAIMNTLDAPFCMLTGNSDAPRNWLVTAAMLKSHSNEASSILYLFRDVTDIDQRITAADHALKTAVKARESITRNLSDMSHEIRTPLMGILGAAHQLKSDACDDEQASDAGEILAGAEELLETVNRILDFSKLEAGKMNKHDEVFPFNDYLESLEAREHPEIIWTVSRSLVNLRFFRGDQHHMLQLLHLLHSFLKGSGTELVRMVLGYEEGCLTQLLHFQVPRHEARELFEHWNHLDGYLTKSWRPDPMKLVLTQKLAKFIGATISLERLDFEWTIRLNIPLAVVTEADAVPIRAPEEAVKPCKLLFAEDSVINQAVIKRMLKALPWDLTFASDGMEALACAQRELYDGIFTDVHMPGLGGIELSYSLQETINSSTPIFALTSDTDAELQETIEQSPIRALLVKPCPKEKLIQLLHENQRIIEYND